MRKCNNCGEETRIERALAIYAQNRLVAIICPNCQQAQKIQLTLTKEDTQWKFIQYFPVEA